MVIPLEIRRRAGLEPGTELEVTQQGSTIRLELRVAPPKLVRRGGRLVVVPTVPEEDRPRVDVAERVAQERDR